MVEGTGQFAACAASVQLAVCFELILRLAHQGDQLSII
jgi:hypothetical protein